MTVKGRQRTEFRAGEMTERGMNDLLRSLYERLEAAERVRYVDLKFSTNAGGEVVGSGIVLQSPPWEVKSITVARLFDPGSGFFTAPPSLVWSSGADGINVTWYQPLGTNASYDLRLELRG